MTMIVKSDTSNQTKSKVGKLPVVIPDGIEVSVDDKKRTLTVKSKHATSVRQKIHPSVKMTIKDGQVNFDGNKMHAGTVRAHCANLVKGHTSGFSELLVLKGVGYRAKVNGNVLDLTIGKSHPCLFPIPDGVTITTPEPTVIEIKGVDIELVGHVAALIVRQRPHEPYKGKGIAYKRKTYIRKASGGK